MRRYQVEVGGKTHVIDVQEVTATEFRVRIGGRELEVTLSAAEDVPETVISPEIVPVREEGGGQPMSTARFKPVAPEALRPMVKAAPPPLPPQPERAGTGAVKAPMPGTVTAVDVKAGESVTAGQVLLRLEAMKMVNAIKAPRAGVVGEVRVQAGESVGYGHVLVTLKEA
jgi:biotin carboxyl carrier protein